MKTRRTKEGVGEELKVRGIKHVLCRRGYSSYASCCSKEYTHLMKVTLPFSGQMLVVTADCCQHMQPHCNGNCFLLTS